MKTFRWVAGMLFIALALVVVTKSSCWAQAKKVDLPVAAIDPAVTAPAEALSKAFANVAAHVAPAVVSVFSEKVVTMRQPEVPPFGEDFFRRFFGNEMPPMQQQPREYSVPQRGMGSGMILDKEGHILTNYHVVANVDEIKVTLADGTNIPAEIVGVDPLMDVAVIRMKGQVPEGLPVVELGDSDALTVGDLVLTIGAPFGYTQTVTNGIISARGRASIGINAYEDFLQTDAPINPGNSGGPLVNMRGQVVGVNSAIATGVGQSAGVGFAIPISMVKTILPVLLKGGKVTRGMLGVSVQSLTGDLAAHFGLSEPKGALVSQVEKDSPAEKAGFKVGDVIVAFDGKEVQDSGHLRNMVAATAPGSHAKVDIIRDGKKMTLEVAVGTLTQEAMQAAGMTPKSTEEALQKLGLAAQTLTPDLAKRTGYDGMEGALVTGVEVGTRAADAGLQPGDLIIEANHNKIASAEDLQSAIARAKETVLLLIRRNKSSLFLVLNVK